MPVAITLCLDAASSQRVSDLCRLLAEHGITDHTVRLGYRPHLTLLRYDELETEAALLALSRFAANELQLSVHLAAVSLFPGDAPVLWLAPVPNVALLSAHIRLHDALKPYVPGLHYQPGTWLPHVTLAEILTPAGASAAVTTVLPNFTPIVGWLDRIELVFFPPVRVTWSAKLKEETLGPNTSEPRLNPPQL